MTDHPTREAVGEMAAFLDVHSATCEDEGLPRVARMFANAAAMLRALTPPATPDPAGNVVEALRVQTDLVGRLCDAVDREAEDIGGESSLTVLRLLGPHHAVAQAALRAHPHLSDAAKQDGEP